MKSTPITIYSGLIYLEDGYIDIESDGEAFDLTDYDLQMQVQDVDDDYSVLVTPTVSKSSTKGRITISMTHDQSTALKGKSAVWVLLMRETGTTYPKLIGYGKIISKRGTTWQ